MNRHQTPEETKSEDIARRKEEFEKVFHELWQEVARLHAKWREFAELFGTKLSRIELMNKSAPSLFRIIHDSLRDDIILHIARLTDRAKTELPNVTKENLTIQRLPEYIDDPELKAKLVEFIQLSIQSADSCLDWRRRQLAHLDLDLAINRGAKPLKPVGKKTIEDALTSIADVLNAVTLHYKDSETRFDIPTGPSGALSLLYVLDDGIRADEERKERMNRGEYDEKDYITRDI